MQEVANQPEDAVPCIEAGSSIHLLNRNATSVSF